MTPARRRHLRVFAVVSVLMRPVMRRLLRFRGEPIPDPGGPVFVLSNHNTDLDCILVGMSARRQIYFVATETLARMGLPGRLVMRWFDPILHRKGVRGTATVRAILERIRDGYSVALFPEGNRSFDGRTCPIPPATAKLARMCGATLITYRLTGGYLSSPRWGRGIRRGQMAGKVMGVYAPETLKAMSAAEVQSAIERDLWTDAYAEQEAAPVRFRGRARAEHLESMLFRCPKCGNFGTLHSRKHRLFCDCGYEMTFTEYGMLEAADGTQYTVTQLDLAQRKALAGLPDDGRLFSDEVRLQTVGSDHAVICEQSVTLQAFHDRLELTEPMPMETIAAMSIVQRNRLLIYPAGSDAHYELTGAPGFNALKYLYLFRQTRPSVNGTL